MPKKGRTPKRSSPASSSSKSSAGASKRQAQSKSDEKKLPDQGPSEEAGFTPRTPDRSVIAIPLLMALVAEAKKGERNPHHVVVDLHLEFPGGRQKAGERLRELLGLLPPRE